MRMLAIAGIALIVAGVLALVYQQFSYTTREQVLKIGPLEATTENKRTLPLPPIVGAAAVAAGIGLLVVARTRKP